MSSKFHSLILFSISTAQSQFESDTIKTTKGELVITFIGHGTLMFTFNNMVIHIDPVGRYADYSKMPKADLILVTHHHGDHLDEEVVNKILKDDSDLILTEACAERMGSGIIMKNGEPRIVFTSIRHGAWAIGTGKKDDDSVSRDLTPFRSQRRFPGAMGATRDRR